MNESNMYIQVMYMLSLKSTETLQAFSISLKEEKQRQKIFFTLERNFTQETQKWKYAVLVRVPENGHSHITGIIISCENLFREQFISIYQNLKHAHSAVNPHLEFSQWICFHMRKKMYVLEKSMAVMSIWKMSTKWVLIKLCYSCTNGILTICYKELV